MNFASFKLSIAGKAYGGSKTESWKQEYWKQAAFLFSVLTLVRADSIGWQGLSKKNKKHHTGVFVRVFVCSRQLFALVMHTFASKTHVFLGVIMSVCNLALCLSVRRDDEPSGLIQFWIGKNE